VLGSNLPRATYSTLVDGVALPLRSPLGARARKLCTAGAAKFLSGDILLAEVNVFLQAFNTPHFRVARPSVENFAYDNGIDLLTA
jgi:hypothetical protein